MSYPDRPFGIYEKALKPQPWNRMFRDVSKAGYQCFEISLDESDARLARLKWTREQFSEAANAAKDNGIRIMSACFSGHRRFPMGSADKKTEARAMEMMQDGIDFCANLGVRILQVAGYDVFYEPRTPDTGKRYCENLAKGAEMAAKAGVMLAIEPVEVFLTAVQDTMKVIRDINSPWLSIYPDVSNMQSLGIDPAKELPYGQGHIVSVHVRDSLPDFFYNVPLGTGILDFASVFRQLDKMSYTGPLTIEMWNQEDPDYFNIIKSAREFMLQKIDLARSEKQTEE